MIIDLTPTKRKKKISSLVIRSDGRCAMAAIVSKTVKRQASAWLQAARYRACGRPPSPGAALCDGIVLYKKTTAYVVAGGGGGGGFGGGFHQQTNKCMYLPSTPSVKIKVHYD